MRYWKAVKKEGNRFFAVDGYCKIEFEVGKTYTVKGKPILNKNGFHFYREKNFCLGVELFYADTAFLEIEPLSEVAEDTEKCISTSIKVIRYIPKKEWKKLLNKRDNFGHHNSGFFNTGNYNSGDRNSGNFNSGRHNSGDSNCGINNTGDCNFGNFNSGSFNSGGFNSGDYNFGYHNSGHFNSGHFNSGSFNSSHGYINYFCTETRYFLFDSPADKETIDKIDQIDMSWFNHSKSYKECWRNCPTEVLDKLKELPELQTEEARRKFKEITGLDIALHNKFATILANRYEYYVKWSPDDDAYVARVTEFPSLSTFGETRERALSELVIVVINAIEDFWKNVEFIPDPVLTKE